jgi:hypothetical protein
MAALSGLEQKNVYLIYAYPGFRGELKDGKYKDPVTLDNLPEIDVVIVDCCKKIFTRETMEQILRSDSAQQKRCPSCRTPLNERIVEKSDFRNEPSIGELQQRIFELNFQLNSIKLENKRLKESSVELKQKIKKLHLEFEQKQKENKRLELPTSSWSMMQEVIDFTLMNERKCIDTKNILLDLDAEFFGNISLLNTNTISISEFRSNLERIMNRLLSLSGKLYNDENQQKQIELLKKVLQAFMIINGHLFAIFLLYSMLQKIT